MSDIEQADDTQKDSDDRGSGEGIENRPGADDLPEGGVPDDGGSADVAAPGRS